MNPKKNTEKSIQLKSRGVTIGQPPNTIGDKSH